MLDKPTMTQKPNYTDLGWATSMGPKLRQLVEQQLLADLSVYNVDITNLKFDWSGSCVEGKCTNYLDGSVDRFSGIAVFDGNDKLIAEGWMEFIHEGDFFIAYWDDVTIIEVDKVVFDKRGGIPNHVWSQIPVDVQPNYLNDREESTTA